MTQVLTSHGCFKSYYKYAIKKAITEHCFYCLFESDTVEHATFGCSRRHSEKMVVEEVVRGYTG